MAIALVSHVEKQSTGSSGAGATSAIDTTGASFLAAAVAFLGTGTSSVTMPTFSDSKSNVWIPIGVPPGSLSAQIVLFVCVNPTVGTGHTFTASSGFCSVAVGAFSGTATDFPFGPGNRSNTTGTSLQPGSITPGRNNCLVIAGLAYRDTTTIAIDSGFTIAGQVPFSSGTAIGVALAYLVQTSAAAANPTFSWTNSVVCSAASLAIQPPAASGGGGGSYAFA